MTGQPSSIPRVGPQQEAIGPGSFVGGRYRVHRLLGLGGMGVVFEASHEGLAERVALKFLLAEEARSPELVARFVREGRAAAKLRSEHVVRVLDVGRTEAGSPYLAMELLDGHDLGHELEQRGPLPIDDVVTALVEICEVLAEAHPLGIVHRDLKPSNLFLTTRADGTRMIKVLDFGIAKAPTDDPGGRGLTTTRAVFGSPAYMAPEQIQSSKDAGPCSDIWSLGVIAYELLTARMPFEGESSAALLVAAATKEPAALRTFRPEVPPDLAAIVHRCLAKDPAARFPSAGALATALAPWARPSVAINVRRAQRLGSLPPAEDLPKRLLEAQSMAVEVGHAVTIDARQVGVQVAPPKAPARSRSLLLAATLAVATLLAIGAFILS